MLTDSDTYYCKLHQKIRHDKECRDPYCEKRYASANCPEGNGCYSVMRCNARDRAYAIYKTYSGKNILHTLTVE